MSMLAKGTSLWHGKACRSIASEDWVVATKAALARPEPVQWVEIGRAERLRGAGRDTVVNPDWGPRRF
jgi:hypothetical protein